MRARSLSASFTRVERKGVLDCSGGAEEVCLCSGGHHEVVRRQHRSRGSGDRSRRRVDRHRRRSAEINGLVVAKDPSQRPSDVCGSYLGRGHLIQHRLELVIVVAVEQNDVDLLLGEVLGAGDAGKAAPNNKHCRVSHGYRLFSRRFAEMGRARRNRQPSMLGTHHPGRVMPRARLSARLRKS
jgi:hypothetical protein